MSSLYRVWVRIDREEGGEREKIKNRTELATFHSQVEAEEFCSELSLRHTAQITGESDLFDEIFTPDLLTSG